MTVKKERKGHQLKQLFKKFENADVKAARDQGDACVDALCDRFGLSKVRGALVFPCGVDHHECVARSGYLDLFSGSGGVAKELARLSGRWVLSYDIVNSPEQDLLKPEVQREIYDLITRRAVVGIGAAPVCASMSRAITPPWRSTAQPEGVQGLTATQQAKLDAGNQFAEFIAKLGLTCIEYQLPFWCENPWLSFLWWIPSIRNLMSRPEVDFWLLDFCALSTPWQKRTRILTNTCLGGQRTLCPGRTKHQLLRGRSTIHKRSWTKVAEPYPFKLASIIAMAMVGATGDRPEFRSLDAAACAKCTHCRVGEAKGPGPRKSTAAERARSRSGLRLADVELVEQKAAQLEARLWDGFIQWVVEDCELTSAETLLAAAVTVAPLLQLYGDYLFRSGATLTSFRHLVAFASRKFVDFKFHSKVCWDYVSRWQSLAPLTHRLPLPWKLCQAMASLALAWKWFRFALTLLIGFLGILRIGEVLKARRRDLVLPTDLLAEASDKLYLKVKEPKTKRRGGGRVQHATVTDKALVRACEHVFGGLPPDAFLYPYSNHTFRRRWDEVLAALGVDKDLALTPGCVRGGAAVHAYQSGVHIQDLLWRMRIQHIGTLQHYLQEMAAESVLGRLSPASRESIRAASSLLPYTLGSLFFAAGERA